MTAAPNPLRLGASLDAAKVLCIFVHGRNQSPEEMGAAVVDRLGQPDIAYVLPRAPGGSWYGARAVDPLAGDTRAALASACTAFARLLADLRGQAPGRPIVLGGFSQGACLALELSCAGAVAPDALVAFTGARVGRAGDDRPTGMQPGLPVYLSAGSDDPWIPLAAFADAAADLGRQGARLRCDIFPARPHEVSAPEIALLASVLSDLAAGQAPAMGAPR